MSNGFLSDLPDLDLPGKRRKKKTTGPKDQVVYYTRIRCPKCDSDKVPVYDSKHLPIRYHKCSDCGLNFKSLDLYYLKDRKA